MDLVSQRISDLEPQSIDMLYQEIGEPAIVAKEAWTRDDYEYAKKKLKNNRALFMASCLIFIISMLFAALGIYLISENNRGPGYYEVTTSSGEIIILN